MFDPIKLEWSGKTITIPANRVMQAIATVEDIVTLVELTDMFQRGAPKYSRIAMAYGALLRFGGMEIKDEDIYTALFDEGSSEQISNGLIILLSMMVPKEKIIEENMRGVNSKKKTSAARISRRRTSSRSVTGQ